LNSESGISTHTFVRTFVFVLMLRTVGVLSTCFRYTL